MSRLPEPFVAQKILDEFRDGVQEARWASEEELRAQGREVEALKSDIRRLNAQKDEVLESQRRDLTQTFENILQQREESFVAKEREIASQVSILESRFESLQTDNTRLKSELAASLRKRESLAEELAAKEEARRQLQWALDDERAVKAQAENMHAHAVQQLTLEISMLKENTDTDVAELKRKLSMVCGAVRCFKWSLLNVLHT
jgi:chromosome segregation ATPase